MRREGLDHLPEEAINDFLIGLGSPQARAHLEVCPDCGSRVREFHAGVKAFNQASLAWSAARPLAVRPDSHRMSARRIAASPWSWALAATLLIGLAFPLWSRHGATQNNAAVATAAQANSEEQIAEDNELLRSVNMALSEGENPPVDDYNLFEKPHARLRARRELRKQ